MNAKLIAAAIAIVGLVACSPDITPQNSVASDAPAASRAAAEPTTKLAQAEKPAATPALSPAADEEKKDASAAPAAAAKTEEGVRKAD